jgi:hypothetical protein
MIADQAVAHALAMMRRAFSKAAAVALCRLNAKQSPHNIASGFSSSGFSFTDEDTKRVRRKTRSALICDGYSHYSKKSGFANYSNCSSIYGRSGFTGFSSTAGWLYRF